jgi:hypothetical protein
VDEDVKVVQSGSKWFKVFQSFSKLRTLGKGAWRLALGAASAIILPLPLLMWIRTCVVDMHATVPMRGKWACRRVMCASW